MTVSLERSFPTRTPSYSGARMWGLLAHRMTCHGCGGDMRWEATPKAKMDGYR